MHLCVEFKVCVDENSKKKKKKNNTYGSQFHNVGQYHLISAKLLYETKYINVLDVNGIVASKRNLQKQIQFPISEYRSLWPNSYCTSVYEI